MHRDLETTYQKIYQEGFIVRNLTPEELASQPGDTDYPSDYPLVSVSHSPKEAQQDLERLRAVGILQLESIEGVEYYQMTELGVRLAQDREMMNRQIELEKQRANRQRELNKGIGFIYLTLVIVTLGSLIFEDFSRLNVPDWQISIVVLLIILTVFIGAGFLFRSFQRADSAGWEQI